MAKKSSGYMGEPHTGHTKPIRIGKSIVAPTDGRGTSKKGK